MGEFVHARTAMPVQECMYSNARTGVHIQQSAYSQPQMLAIAWLDFAPGLTLHHIWQFCNIHEAFFAILTNEAFD